MSIDPQLLKTTRKIVVALIEAGKLGLDQVPKEFDKICKSIGETTGELQSEDK